MIWVLLVPSARHLVGLAYAVFIDKSRGETYYKSLMFMPMAISFVGASIIWKFVYAYRPAGARADRPAEPDRRVASAANPCSWLQTEPLNTSC